MVGGPILRYVRVDRYHDVHTGRRNVGLYLCTNLIYFVVFWCSIFGDAGEPMVSRTDIIKKCVVPNPMIRVTTCWKWEWEKPLRGTALSFLLFSISRHIFYFSIPSPKARFRDSRLRDTPPSKKCKLPFDFKSLHSM